MTFERYLILAFVVAGTFVFSIFLIIDYLKKENEAERTRTNGSERDQAYAIGWKARGEVEKDIRQLLHRERIEMRDSSSSEQSQRQQD